MKNKQNKKIEQFVVNRNQLVNLLIMEAKRNKSIDTLENLGIKIENSDLIDGNMKNLHFVLSALGVPEESDKGFCRDYFTEGWLDLKPNENSANEFIDKTLKNLREYQAI